MKVTILGSGGSGGVPLPGGPPGGEPSGNWGNADPNNPKNRRMRVSVLIETAGKTLLIDTSPDFRQQALRFGITHLDAVLFTHAHADHTHGLDDLRALSYVRKAPIPAYMSEDTRSLLTLRFDYAFSSSHPQERLYPAIMEDKTFGGSFEAAGIPVTAFPQDHGNVTSWGFRIGGFGYSTDVVSLDEAAFEALSGIELWIVDCLREEPHPTHSHFAQTLQWIERVRPKRAALTHLNHSVDYDTLAAKCPPGVEPAYDGLAFELPDP